MLGIGGRIEVWHQLRTNPDVVQRSLAVLKQGATAGDRLRALREHAGLYQRDVTQLLSLGQDRVYSLENNRAQVTQNEVHQLSELFGIPADALASYLSPGPNKHGRA